LWLATISGAISSFRQRNKWLWNGDIPALLASPPKKKLVLQFEQGKWCSRVCFFFLTRMAPWCWNGWKREVQLMQTDSAIPYANGKQPSRIADVACCQKGLLCRRTMPVLSCQASYFEIQI
jgi:hypothetical protein